MTSPTFDLLLDLLRRRSITPEDAGCQAVIAARLERAGFRCERVDSGAVSNLWARRGAAAPSLCFAGHTDVVPTGPLEAWRSDPFEPEIRDGRLYARGAADMKASLAAMVVAVEEFVAAHPRHPGSIAVLLTSDEEGPATEGTLKVVERLAAAGERLDYCVVGEPTSVDRLGDMIKNGRRGTLSGRLTVRGIQGHVAYPHLARNPIHQCAPALAELAATTWDAGNAFFPPTTWQVSNIHGGTGANNVIPGSVEILFNFRYSTASTRRSLQDRLEAVLQRHRLDYALEWYGHGKPFLTPRGRLVAQASAAIREVCGVDTELSCTGGTSDGRFLADVCAEVVEFGPPAATIHKIDECVALADLDPLKDVYRRLLERLLAGGG